MGVVWTIEKGVLRGKGKGKLGNEAGKLENE